MSDETNSVQEGRIISRRKIADEAVMDTLERENLVGDAFPHIPVHIDEMLPRSVDEVAVTSLSQILGEMRQNGYDKDEIDRALNVVLPLLKPAAYGSRRAMRTGTDLDALREKLASAKQSMNSAIVKLRAMEAEDPDE